MPLLKLKLETKTLGDSLNSNFDLGKIVVQITSRYIIKLPSIHAKADAKIKIHPRWSFDNIVLAVPLLLKNK
jgi:hypothetical protein